MVVSISNGGIRFWCSSPLDPREPELTHSLEAIMGVAESPQFSAEPALNSCCLYLPVLPYRGHVPSSKLLPVPVPPCSSL